MSSIEVGGYNLAAVARRASVIGLATLAFGGTMTENSQAITYQAGPDATPSFMQQLRANEASSYMPSPRVTVTVNQRPIATDEADPCYVAPENRPPGAPARIGCTIFAKLSTTYDSSQHGLSMRVLEGHEEGHYVAGVIAASPNGTARLKKLREGLLLKTGAATTVQQADNLIEYGPATTDPEVAAANVNQQWITQYFAETYNHFNTFGLKSKGPVYFAFNGVKQPPILAHNANQAGVYLKAALLAMPDLFDQPAIKHPQTIPFNKAGSIWCGDGPFKPFCETGSF